MPFPPGSTASAAQLAALDRGRKLRHEMAGPNIASRIFQDAVAAIEQNGSAKEYFRHVAEHQPVAFLKLLKHLAVQYLLRASNIDLEGERIFRSPEEIREGLKQRRLSPEFLAELVNPAQAAEKQALMEQKQALEARARAAEAERDRLRQPPTERVLRVVKASIAEHASAIPPEKAEQIQALSSIRGNVLAKTPGASYGEAAQTPVFGQVAPQRSGRNSRF